MNIRVPPIYSLHTRLRGFDFIRNIWKKLKKLKKVAEVAGNVATELNDKLNNVSNAAVGKRLKP